MGLDPILIQFAWTCKCFLNRFLGDLVEDDPVILLGVRADHLFEMPGDGFSLAIKVSGEIDGITFSRQLLKFVDDLDLVGQYLVIRLPPLIRIDAHIDDQISAGFLLSIPRLLGRRHFTSLGRLLSTLLGIYLLF